MKHTAIAGAILIVVLLSIVGAVIYGQSGNTINTTSTLVLSPTPSLSPTKTPEPLITSWKTYQNDTYNFSLSVPDSWNQQEYTPQSGNFQIAFSPNSLPCSTCTYVHEGYFSVKIFNQKTDAQAYTLFTQRKQSVGKSNDYKEVQLAGKTGVMNSNSIDLENNGWVYELSLDKDNGTDQVTDSQIFQKAALSLQFTNLLFNY